jgi:hypothetical protein
MPNLNDTITDFVAGDTVEVTRTITGIPAGQTIAKAWLMVKVKETDPDASAIISKTITTTDAPGTGHITDTGADGTGAVRFDLTHDDTELLVRKRGYMFAIKIRTSTGNLYTPFKGTVTQSLRAIEAES